MTASRSAEDQRELALGVLRRDAAGAWTWKMDPAYIQQRVQHGPPRRPDLWPVLGKVPCPTLVVWGTTSDVLSEAQARRMVEVLPQGELVTCPAWPTRRRWWNRSCWPRSSDSSAVQRPGSASSVSFLTSRTHAAREGIGKPVLRKEDARCWSAAAATATT